MFDLPTTITWKNPAGGLWNQPTNWQPAQVPGPLDTAVDALRQGDVDGCARAVCRAHGLSDAEAEPLVRWWTERSRGAAPGPTRRDDRDDRAGRRGDGGR